jgi:hypothetical protein
MGNSFPQMAMGELTATSTWEHQVHTKAPTSSKTLALLKKTQTKLATMGDPFVQNWKGRRVSDMPDF